MSVFIHHLVIHELEKAADESAAHLFLTQHCMVVDEQVQALADKLNTTFIRKDDNLQGYLSPPEDALFPAYFQVMMDAGITEQSFLAFSKDTMSALQLSLQGVLGAKGGYLVYIDYTEEASNQRVLGIFLVRDTEGVAFRKQADAAVFAIESVTHLNTDRLAMACRILTSKFESGQGRCVELIKHAKSQKEISEYFIQWIGLERPESSQELTTSFLEMVNALPLPMDEGTGQPMAEGQFREKVLQFATSSPQKVISIPAFEQAFYQNEQPAQQYMQEQQVELDQEFRFDKRTLNQFYNHKVNAEKIYLYFNQGHLKEGQIVVEGDKVSIHCAELAEQIADLLRD